MKAWLPTDLTESSRPKPGSRIGILEKFLRLFAEIGRSVNAITHFLRPRQPASQFTVEQRDESALEQAGATAATTENVVANLTTESFTARITTGVKVDTDAQIDSAGATVLDQEEIQRRRDLVRTLFNDFWSGAHDKPTTFVERLDQAEDYLNERLAETGEFWQLDTNTRVMLGLPPRANSPNNGKNRAAPG
jgi:hypothetical protein